MQLLSLTLLALILQLTGSQASSGSFVYSRGPVPDTFHQGTRYPDRSETDECRPIRLRVERNSILYRTQLVTNTHPRINFQSADARLMTARLQSRLNALAAEYYRQYSRRITVLQAWSEYAADDGLGDPHSLHYEGRTVRVRVKKAHFSLLLKLAVEYGFDWVYYASSSYIRLSVIPDGCNTNLDLVFMLDQSGSVGAYNHYRALNFIHDVTSFFDISQNATQVGLVTYSTYARVEFSLGELTDLTSVRHSLNSIPYRGGWTSTAWALYWANVLLNPSEGYGARPDSLGIPKIAVLITDGRSNLFPIEPYASFLRESGVQVFTVGIGNIYLPELLHIASDPDEQHLFLLDSFSDATNFVDFLSFTTCDSPAIVEPGENTTTDVDEDDFRYFQSACPAFSQTVMIEQIDIIGKCSLYASTSVQNPGPLSSQDLVVRNENTVGQNRSVLLYLHQDKFVYVSVRGLTPHNKFTVIIWDMIFAQDLYIVRVPEGVAQPVLFDLLSVLLPTNVTFNFTIKSGNENDYFSLGLQTGVLSLLHPLSLSPHQQSHFLLTIVAQNSEFSCHRGRVQIIVIIVRDGIELPSLEPVSVPEDAGIGTEIALVEVLGDTEGVTYSLVGGNEGDVFAINATSGRVTVASGLDFETVSSFSLTIAATDERGNSDSATLSVTVLDVNEPPVLTDPPCAVKSPADGSPGECVFSVLENQPLGTPVAEIVADDPDLSFLPNGNITFELLDDAPFSLTRIDNTVTVATVEIFDREAVPSYSFTLRVSDMGTPPLSCDVLITVNVGDLNDNAPEFVQEPTSPLLVLETASEGDVIGEYITIDLDEGENAVVAYSLAPVDPSLNASQIPFAVDPSSGVLTVSAPLDFESATNFEIQVIASNPDGLQSSTITVIVILDVNDNPPIFTQQVYEATVEEGASAFTVVRMVLATDADVGLNGRVEYTITAGNIGDSFSTSEAPVGGGSDDITGLIVVQNPIDRETIQFFNLTVTATDQGSPPLSDVATVLVTVLDVNDNAPVFEQDSFEILVREDTAPILALLNLTATDLDQPGTPNSEIVFSINSTANITGVFDLVQIDNNVATLRLIGQLDFDVVPLYQLVVTAADRAVPSLANEALIMVLIRDVGSPPVVSGNQAVNVSEGEATGTLIARINATDLDNQTLNFSIVSVTSSGRLLAVHPFEVRSDGGVVLVSELDFESLQSYVITILVTDGLLNAETILTVNVLDENEFTPIIEPATFEIEEEVPIGTFVGTVVATDGDAGQSAILTFGIFRNSLLSTLLDIDPVNGSIFVSDRLDREAVALQDDIFPPRGITYDITVIVTDGGVPSRTAARPVGISLIDINDNAPSFNEIPLPLVVVENGPESELVVTVTAIDPDLGPNGEVAYSIDGDVPFVIDAVSGELRTNGSLDAEVQTSYTFSIVASDNGSPVQNTSISVTVFVEDLNDNVPMFEQDFYELVVDENLEIGESFFQFVATDADATPPNNVVRYSIVSADPDESLLLFSLDPINGSISTLDVLDFETTPTHELVVTARDLGSPSFTATASVLITVRDINEEPPRFLGECSISISEVTLPPNSDPSAIGECRASDVDDATGENDFTLPLSYEILNGNFNGTFSIGDDGTVFLVRSVDREVIDSFSILLVARDEGGLNATTLLSVTILDLNDNSPVVLNGSPIRRNVTDDEISSGVMNFVSVEASDADAGTNAELSFSLSQSVIDAQGLSAQFTVTVSDNGEEPRSTVVEVFLFFESPCFLQDHTLNNTDGRIFSQLLCSVDLAPPTLTVAVGDSFELTCEALTNMEVGFSFRHVDIGNVVLSGAGEVLVVQNVSMEDAGTYFCSAMFDSGILFSSASVVTVLEAAGAQAPSIVQPLTSLVTELSGVVVFRCPVSGNPQPAVTWSRTVGGVEEQLTPGQSTRIAITGTFLTISPTTAADSGVYTCTATNPSGQVTSSAFLTLVSQSNVVLVEMEQFSNPDVENKCHVVDIEGFEALMSDITGVTVTLVDQSGDNLCPDNPCNSAPCLNGGQCEVTNTTDEGYTCTCAPGYQGVNCGEDIDECAEGVCQFEGICTNTPGSFDCSCSEGLLGHRCQYRDVCTPSTCPTNQECVTTVTNSQGFTCVDVSEGSDQFLTVAVDMTDARTLGGLDDQVNAVQEMSEPMSTRRKRRQAATPNEREIEQNGFVTVCEARFLPLTSETAILVWACPMGVPAPFSEDLEEICRVLFASRSVGSCATPSGLALGEEAEELPSTDATLSIVLVDEDGNALDSSEALDLLQETGALDTLREQGFQVTGFSALLPATSTEAVRESADFPVAGIIAGAVVGTLLVVTVIVLLIAIICYRTTRRGRKAVPTSSDSTPEHVYHLDNSTAHLPLKGQSSNSSSFKEPETESLFDDPIYGQGQGYAPPTTPPATKTPLLSPLLTQPFAARLPSLKRSIMSSLKGKSESMSDLLEDSTSLSGDYHQPQQLQGSGQRPRSVVSEDGEAVVPPPAIPLRAIINESSLREELSGGDMEESVLYCNAAHYRLGAVGNAGERWESRQNTDTLFKTKK